MDPLPPFLRSTRNGAICAALALATVGVVPGRTQNVPAPADQKDDKVVTLETYEVTGYRESLANSLEAEQAAVNLKSVISADALGNLPDKNVADALGRLAGISTSVSDGESRFVTIRGVEPGLNGITLNGETVATSDSNGRAGRAAPLDVLSSATAGSIEVNRTVTPAMDGQSVGGTINIITPSAFDYDKPLRVFGSAEWGINDMDAKKDIYSGTINYAQRFMDNKLGVFASYINARTNYVAESVQMRRWTDDAQPTVNYYPREIRMSYLTGHRDRTGLTANVEFRPDNERKFYFRIYTTDYDNHQDRPQFTGRLKDFVYDSPTSGSGAVHSLTYEERIETTARTTDQYVLGAEIPLGDSLKLDLSGTYSEALEDNPLLTYIQFIGGWDEAGNRYLPSSGGRFDITNSDYPQITFPASIYEPYNWKLSVVRPESSHVFHKTKTYKGDLEWKGELFGRNATVKGGIKFLDRRKSVRDTSPAYSPKGYAIDPSKTVTFATDIPGYGPAGARSPDLIDGRYVFGLRANSRNVLDYFEATRPPFNGEYVDAENDDWTFLAAYSEGNSIEDRYDLHEKINAGYLMATVDVSPKLQIVGGVRAEHTKENLESLLNAYISDDSGIYQSVDPIILDHSYTNVLPNLQFKYNFTDRLLLRGAVTYTIGRPDFVDMAPISTIEAYDEDHNGLLEGYLEIGNPDLKPYESTNIDVYLSYYLPNAGVVSLGYFGKRIKNPIYDWSKLETDVTFQGEQYETLSKESVFNADDGKIDGLEFIYQQNFQFLPHPFDGLGLVANYCVITSSVKPFGRTDEVRFFNQPNHTLNLQLFYQTRRWDARLAYHWQGSSLDGVGDGAYEDDFNDERESLDFKGSVHLNDNLSVYGEVRNITSDTERSFIGDPRYISYINKWGVTYLTGLTWSY